ncbi:unnamed protein product, partial [Symbiodinium pilosum]
DPSGDDGTPEPEVAAPREIPENAVWHFPWQPGTQPEILPEPPELSELPLFPSEAPQHEGRLFHGDAGRPELAEFPADIPEVLARAVSEGVETQPLAYVQGLPS